MAIGTGLAILGSAIIGAASSKHSADKQAGAVKSGEAAALAENQRQFDLTRADTAPIRALGNNAISTLSRLYGYGSPGTAAPVPTSNGYSSVGARIAGRVLGR